MVVAIGFAVKGEGATFESGGQDMAAFSVHLGTLSLSPKTGLWQEVLSFQQVAEGAAR